MLSSMIGCATHVTKECVWVAPITPDPGFETRWTRNEKIQALQHNEKIAALCR